MIKLTNNVKKVIFICLISLTIIFSGCSFPINKSSTDALSLIKKSGVIKVGIEKNYPPFIFVKNNEPVGIDIDIINEIAKKIGVKTEFVMFNNIDDIISVTNDNKFDVAISAISITNKRALNISFSNPYYNETNTIVTTKNNNFENKNINNKKIGVENNSTQANFIKTKTKKVVEKDNVDELVKMLENKKIDEIFLPTSMANLIISKYKNIKIIAQQLQGSDVEHYGIALPGIKHRLGANAPITANENQESLLNIINKTIDELTKSMFIENSEQKNIKIISKYL
jgi:polar amino acid transport system substrate-binding protein